MLKFYPATIVSKTSETPDSILLTLSVADDAADAFRYTQGQHLLVRSEIDGDKQQRTYSICASVNDRTLRLGIRLQKGFSKYLAKRLEVGDIVEIMPPAGKFQTALDPAQSKTYAAFAAGSGITPILSIVKTTLETEPDSRFVLFYGNRKRSTTMFIDELWDLKNLYPERLALHFITSREENEIEIYSGRIDRARTNALHDAFLKNSRPDDIFICGPGAMIEDVRGSLLELDYDPSRLHAERFRTEQTAQLAEKQSETRVTKGTTVSFIMDGNTQSFEMRDSTHTLLDAAEENGFDLPFACRGGVCSTCRAMLSKGKVTMAANSALEDWEIEEGFILVCQSRPDTDEIELDYDQA